MDYVRAGILRGKVMRKEKEVVKFKDTKTEGFLIRTIKAKNQLDLSVELLADLCQKAREAMREPMIVLEMGSEKYAIVPNYIHERLLRK